MSSCVSLALMGRTPVTFPDESRSSLNPPIMAPGFEAGCGGGGAGCCLGGGDAVQDARNRCVASSAEKTRRRQVVCIAVCAGWREAGDQGRFVCRFCRNLSLESRLTERVCPRKVASRGSPSGASSGPGKMAMRRKLALVPSSVNKRVTCVSAADVSCPLLQRNVERSSSATVPSPLKTTRHTLRSGGAVAPER